jgi:nitrogen fixation NifU-like protein
LAARGPEPQFDELYRDLILDHYRLPRNRKVLDEAEVDLTQFNPVCGDEIRVTARLQDGRIQDVAFVGQGCSISQSSASMMTEAVKGTPVEDAEHLAADFRGMLQGKPADEDEMGDLIALQGVSKYPVRVKCAVLAWDTLQKALERYKKDGAAKGRELTE